MLVRTLQILLLFICMNAAAGELITQADVAKFANYNSLDQVVRKTVNFGNGLKVPIEFSITLKGNGGFSLPGLFLVRIYDEHDDGSYFKGGLLDNDLVDLDGDGYKELLLWGIAIKTDEDTDKILGEVPVVALIKYDPNHKVFRVVKKSQEIDIYEKN